MMNKKILMFDFDGTIADTFELTVTIINRLSTQFNYKKIESYELNRLRNMPTRTFIRHLQIPLLKVPMVVAKGRAEMRSEAASVMPVRGLADVLQHLRSKNFKFGLLTSNANEFVKDFLKRNNLQVFDLIYASSSIWGKGKRLNSFMAKYDLSPEDVLYIGDETRDIEAARSSGIEVVAVTWGYNSQKALIRYKPDYLVTDPQELLQIL